MLECLETHRCTKFLKYIVDLVMMVTPVVLYTADDRRIYQIILNY
jgi:hypothetical protein